MLVPYSKSSYHFEHLQYPSTSHYHYSIAASTPQSKSQKTYQHVPKSPKKRVSTPSPETQSLIRTTKSAPPDTAITANIQSLKPSSGSSGLLQPHINKSMGHQMTRVWPPDQRWPGRPLQEAGASVELRMYRVRRVLRWERILFHA